MVLSIPSKISIVLKRFGYLLAILIFLGVGGATAQDIAEPLQFVDFKKGTSFKLHADPFDPIFGNFAFTVLRQGTYLGGNPESISFKDQGVILLRFEGIATLITLDEMTSSRKISILGEIGPKKGNAQVILRVKDSDGNEISTFQMISHEPTFGEAKQIVGTFELETEKGNWEALYDLFSSTFTEGKTPQEFAEELSLQDAIVGRIVDVQILSDPQIEFSPLGLWFFTVRVRVTSDKDGNLISQEFTDYFVLEEGGWRFWFSAED